MAAHSEETRQKVLELLKNKRSRKEIHTRTGVTFKTTQLWAEEWRSQGLLPAFKREGMNFTGRARLESNGYYPRIRKIYNGMRWTDKCNSRTFGFNNIVESLPFFLDSAGRPWPCAYCGREPEQGRVWGLDRLDSAAGHAPGNLLPCCSSHPESHFLSCQASKSKFSLFNWLEASMRRAFGDAVSRESVEQRIAELKCSAQSFVLDKPSVVR